MSEAAYGSVNAILVVWGVQVFNMEENLSYTDDLLLKTSDLQNHITSIHLDFIRNYLETTSLLRLLQLRVNWPQRDGGLTL